jgi:hypothetical protein
MLAPAIGVERAVERDVGRGVEGQDRLGEFGRDTRAQARRRTIDDQRIIAPVAISLARGKAKARGNRARLRTSAPDSFHGLIGT